MYNGYDKIALYVAILLSVMWYLRVFEYRIKGGIVVHKDTIKRISKLESLLEEKNRTIQVLNTRYAKKDRSGQYEMPLAVEKNGHKPTLLWWHKNPETGKLESYNLVFRNFTDKQWFNSEDYVWVERKHTNVGKRRETRYSYEWVHVDDLITTDKEILANFPYMPDDKSRTKLIPDRYLPFKWEYCDIVKPEFSVKEM